MSWGRLDDSMAFHRKVLAAGNEAVGAWARMISQSCCELTDGRVARSTALAIASTKALKRLVDAGLLETLPSGDYQIHDFLDWNPSADDVKTKRERDIAQRKAAGTRGAEARWGRKHGEQDGEPPSPSPSRTHSESPSRSPSASDGSRTHPIPSHPIPEEKSPLPPVSERGENTGDKPSETTREQDYQRAYESGIREALGRSWTMPEAQRRDLHQALVDFAKDPKTGEKLRGPRVLRWLTFQAKELVRIVGEKGDDPKFWSSYGPRGMVRMLNELPEVDERESGVIVLRGAAGFEARRVPNGG